MEHPNDARGHEQGFRMSLCFGLGKGRRLDTKAFLKAEVGHQRARHRLPYGKARVPVSDHLANCVAVGVSSHEWEVDGAGERN